MQSLSNQNLSPKETTAIAKTLSNLLGAIHKGRPHLRGEGGSVKSGQMRTQGGGGSVAKSGRPQFQIFT